MKKVKRLKILLVVIALCVSASLGTLASSLSVDAANNECSSGYTAENYMNKLSYSISGNVVTYTGAQGLAYSTSFDGTQYPVDESGSFSFTIPDSQMGNRITVYFYLVQDDGVCEANKEVGRSTFYADSTGRNQLYDDALCVNYRNKWSDNETMRNAVQYCFTETVSVQYSYDEVSSWINEAESLYQISQGGTTIETDPSYTNVDDVTNTDTLTCDAFSTNNYETMHKYSHSESETVNNCTTTCVEEIEVNFSDPVATEPGMCFQYLIEIKSKVECNNTYTAPRPSKPAVCVPTVECVASNGYESDKGGPTEDFDACINQCDGGEYTQSCIDKCYTSVYEKGETYSEKVVNRQTTFAPINSLLEFNVYTTNGEQRARQIADNCITEDASLTLSQAEALYNQKQKYPGGHYNGNKWVPGGTCSSKIGYYYFRTLEATRSTINELNGSYSDSHGKKQYAAGSNGFLQRKTIDGYTNVCDDTCKWINSCSSNTVLTQYLAEQQYQKELAEWESAKAACEGSSGTCTNETTDYKIVVDNLDTNDSVNDTDKSDWQEEFSSSQKLNGDSVTGNFPDMVILTDGVCEDGEDDPWDYHNIITFPGTWVNNKTGQTAHSIEPGFEDFYTYVGNEYCTKLNSIPVNTAWWYWKVVQNGDESVLTDSQKEEINNSLEMNIRGSIDNYGYFGWDFDIECFYAIDDELNPNPENNETCSETDPYYPTCEPPGSCPADDPDYPYCDCPESDPNYPYCKDDDGGNDTIVTDYDFRPISLDNMFPDGGSASQTSANDKDTQASNLINNLETLRNSGTSLQPVASATREPGFNWSCEATNLENPDYIVQPVTVMNEIQALGDSIYDGDKYLDYHIRLTPETMNKVKDYNRDYDAYTEPSSDNSNEVLTAGSNKTAGVTVYRSYLLHKVLNSNELLKSGLIGCNNEDDGTCPNVIDTTTSCYQEYMSQSAVLKGGN